MLPAPCARGDISIEEVSRQQVVSDLQCAHLLPETTRKPLTANQIWLLNLETRLFFDLSVTEIRKRLKNKAPLFRFLGQHLRSRGATGQDSEIFWGGWMNELRISNFTCLNRLPFLKGMRVISLFTFIVVYRCSLLFSPCMDASIGMECVMPWPIPVMISSYFVFFSRSYLPS